MVVYSTTPIPFIAAAGVRVPQSLCLNFIFQGELMFSTTLTPELVRGRVQHPSLENILPPFLLNYISKISPAS